MGFAARRETRAASDMNNTMAIIIGLCLIGLVIFDMRVNDSEYIIIWGKQLLRLIDWIAFWR